MPTLYLAAQRRHLLYVVNLQELSRFRLRLSSRDFRRAFRVDADEFAFLTFVFKFDKAFDQRKERIVFTDSDVFARFPFRAALTRQNVSAENVFAAEFLQAQSLRV